MAHDVFISHSKNDKLAADAICHALEQNGVHLIKALKNVLGMSVETPKQVSQAPPKPIQINIPASGDKKTVGVEINGVIWAPCNVDAPGTFAAKPEDAGMFYQWNRKKAWPATDEVTGWNASVPEGNTWEKANDPSPAGWRVPTEEEIDKLLDKEKVTNEWTILNGVNGRKFTDRTSGKSIFLPAAGYRGYFDGALYDVGYYGYYWGSTQNDGNDGCVYYLDFGSDNAYWGGWSSKSNALTVRPVAE